MALYINHQANFFQIEEKTTKKGKQYVSCNVVFYSKSKDRKTGDYSVEDEPFSVRGVAFGNNAKFLISRKDDKVFAVVMGKLVDTVSESEGKKVYSKRLEIFSLSDVFPRQEADADDNENDFDGAEA